MPAAQTPNAAAVRGTAMVAASRGEETTSKGCNQAVMRAPPKTAPAVEPVAVADTQCNDDTVTAVESVCFTMLLTVPHDAFAVNGLSRQTIHCGLSMLDAGGVPAGWQHLNRQSSSAAAAVSRRLKRSGLPALGVVGIGECAAAPIAPGLRQCHNVADRALTGIDSSSRRSRSALAGRPNVVR
jgi:hypothetical protein